jgi:hypothetical protein
MGNCKAVAAPTVTLATEPDPHPEWARQAAAIAAQLDTPGLIDDDDTGPYCDRMAAFYDLICDTPARTYVGVREQIAFVQDSIRYNCPGEREKAALANALATLERLTGESAHG